LIVHQPINPSTINPLNHILITTALIIAAGSGSRLQEVTGSIPKSLFKIAGVPIIKRIIKTAKKAGIERFVIVTGYAADQLHDLLDHDTQVSDCIEWVHNDQWQLPNGVSALAARPFIEGPFALLMADHLFEEQTLTRLLETSIAHDECILAVDRKIEKIYDIEDATKVQDHKGQVVRINKTLDDYNAIDTGMFLCTPTLFEALASSLTEEGCSLSDGIQSLAQRGKMRTFDVGTGFWQDVDTPDMLAHAEKMLLRRLRKPTDGWVSRYINRPISTRISRWLVRTSLTPNMVTLITFATGLLGAWFVADGTYGDVLAGAFLFQLSSILDGCDGEVAKLTFRESTYGSWLDTITDNLTYVAFFAAVVWAHGHLVGTALIWSVGIASVAMVTISILVMYYYLLHTGEGGSLVRFNVAFEEHAARPQASLIARIMNVLRMMSKRDFFTMVLLCFAALDLLSWMFWTISIGGIGMAVAVFISTGRLLAQDREAASRAEQAHIK
jgi:CDP-L-myo-inositol myo-inositolphosphotransferase